MNSGYKPGGYPHYLIAWRLTESCRMAILWGNNGQMWFPLRIIEVLSQNRQQEYQGRFVILYARWAESPAQQNIRPVVDSRLSCQSNHHNNFKCCSCIDFSLVTWQTKELLVGKNEFRWSISSAFRATLQERCVFQEPVAGGNFSLLCNKYNFSRME